MKENNYIKISTDKNENVEFEINNLSDLDILVLFGQYIDFLRKELKITKKSMLEMINFSYDYDSKIERFINDIKKVEDNEKNVDTIHELVNIIQEALREINDIYKPSPKIMKIKKILLKYKENNYDVK